MTGLVLPSPNNSPNFVAVKERQFPAVAPLSIVGKVLVGILRIISRLCSPFFPKNRPLPDFEENPKYFTIKELLFFSYKYYLNPPEQAEDDELTRYFNEMKFEFPQDDGAMAQLKLSCGGDLMPYQWLNAETGAHIWDQIGGWFFNADLVYANLETPIDRNKPLSAVPEVMLSNMRFNGDEKLFHLFNGMGIHKGFDVLCTANNHSLDMGEAGLKATLDFLDEKGIMHCGTARDEAETKRVVMMERNGIKIGFVAFTYCLNDLSVEEGKSYLVNHERLNLPGANLEAIKQQVLEARKGADFVVLALHNGNAYQAYPSAHTVKNIHRVFSECGPDLILGSHPHNPQPLEQIQFVCPYTGREKRGIAVYSQGDFVAYDIFTWCHLHLGIQFQISKFANGETAITGMEVMPQHLVMNKVDGLNQFKFVPLLSKEGYGSNCEERIRNERAELLRFWNQHLSPQLSHYAV